MMLSTGMPELQAEADLEYMRTQLQLDQSSEEQVLKFLSFIFLYFYIFIFIGPNSDHWECLSLREADISKKCSSLRFTAQKLKLHIKSMYLFQYFAGLEITFGKNTVYTS